MKCDYTYEINYELTLNYIAMGLLVKITKFLVLELDLLEVVKLCIFNNFPGAAVATFPHTELNSIKYKCKNASRKTIQGLNNIPWKLNFNIHVPIDNHILFNGVK